MTIHVTPIPKLTTLTTPAFTLGTVNTAGSAITAVASDSTLLAFDATVPDAITFGQSGAAGSATVASRRDHAHAMAADPAKLVVIGTAVASDSASLTITGITSDYDTYMISLSDLVPADDGYACGFRLGDSGGVDSGASDYSYHTSSVTAGDAAYGASVSTGATRMRFGLGGTGNGAGEGLGWTFFLDRPTDGTSQPMVFGNHSYWNGSTALYGGLLIGGRNAVISVDRIFFQFVSGNIATGRMTVWGILHA